MRTAAAALVPAAIDRFGARVRAVPGDRWDAPTPCSEWSVRDLVNHLVFEHAWAPHVLDGETIAQVGDRYDGDLVGADPVAAWTRVARTSREAWLATSGTGTVHLSFGDAPLTEYAEQMLVDLTVHEWDLARGSGQHEDLDPKAVDRCLPVAREVAAQFASAGLLGPPVPTSSTDPAVRLLAALGRDTRSTGDTQ